MKRRDFLRGAVGGMLSALGWTLAGCRGRQHAQILRDDQADIVGSHTAGASTFQPLIQQAVGRLLARQTPAVHPAGGTLQPGPRRICFVGLENRSAEELGDFRDQIVDTIENHISQSNAFVVINRRFVQAGLRQCRVRPDELFVPQNQRNFLAVMEQSGQPFDYLLFARLTSGTTRSNNNTQRDYQLTMELVNIQTGTQDRESATIRKGYHQSRIGRRLSY